MASFLRQIFCCLGKRAREPATLDDRSRLIPASTGDVEALTNEVQGSGKRVVFDQVRFHERLGGIVRSKEGKMVNVTSPLPFNLHNKPRALLDIMAQDRSGTYNYIYASSTSRSASASTSQSPNAHASTNTRPPPGQHIHSGLRITPINSTPHSRSRSRSHSSVALAYEEEEPVDTPAPRLGVRLVHGYGALGNNGTGAAGRRGRAKVKKELDAGVDGNVVVLEADTLSTATIPDPGPPDIDSNTPRPHPRLAISPESDMVEFRIRDVAAVSVSWGE